LGHPPTPLRVREAGLAPPRPSPLPGFPDLMARIGGLVRLIARETGACHHRAKALLEFSQVAVFSG